MRLYPLLVTLLFLVTACGGGSGSGSAASKPAPQPVVSPPKTLFRAAAVPAGDVCIHSQVELHSGLDEDRDGVLNDAEITQSERICVEDQPDGALMTYEAVPIGGLCALGGGYLTVGRDQNQNLSLEAEEVGFAGYVCESLTSLVVGEVSIQVPDSAEHQGQLALSDAQNLTYLLVQTPTSGEVVLNGDNSFTYTPQPGYVGGDLFSYQILDGEETVTQTVRIEVFLGVPLIALSPAEIPAMVVERYQQASQSVTISNVGHKPLDFSIELVDEAGSTVANKRIMGSPKFAQKISKGQPDLRVGSIGEQGRSGADGHGYYWIDSNQPGGPEFSWIDISTSGTLLPGLWDDSFAGPVPLGFDFNFYGRNYDQIFVSSNGFLAFDTSTDNGCCSGQPLPAVDSVNNIIAWLWRDLHPRGGRVYYQTLDEQRFVIQFVDYGDYQTSGVVNAEVIIYRSGKIVLQYLSFEQGLEDTNYSIGIENAVGDEGLQVAFNQPYLENHLAVLITEDRRWFDLDKYSGSVPAGASEVVTLSYHSDVAMGDYSAQVTLQHNDPEKEQLVFTVDMSVGEDVTSPLAIQTLSADSLSFDRARIQWQASIDQGVGVAPLAGYEIRYSQTPIETENWLAATLVNVEKRSAEQGSQESVIVDGLMPETEYYFAVRVADESGNMSPISNVASVATPALPEISLSANSLSFELTEGGLGEGALQIGNVGGSNLQYSFRVEDAEPASAVAGIRHKAKGDINPERHTIHKVSKLPELGKYVAGELIVRFQGKAAFNQSLGLMQRHGAALVRRIEPLQMEIWRLTDENQLQHVIQQLNTRDDIVFAEPNYRLQIYSAPNDAMFGELWGLDNQGSTGGTIDADIDALEAWSYTAGSRDVVVAVIDTGIDYGHSDLADNIWVNAGEIAGNGLDDDGNGYIDDVHGYDFVNGDGDPADDNGHGTHVAGTIGAIGNNGYGVVGVNQHVSLMAVKFLGGAGGGSTEDAISSIVYAVENGATILNNSWGGGGYSEALLAAIQFAHDNGVLFVAAAGNAGTDNDFMPSYPASYSVDNIISVAATDHNDNLAAFSQFGLTSVDLAAPGVNIMSTLPGESFASFNGTSMATPHVAGAAALLKAYRPDLPSSEIKQLLMDSVDPVETLVDKMVTGGRLNINSALERSGPSWIRLLSERSGELTPGDTVNLALSLDATGMSAGEHYVQLIIESNDPSRPTVAIPVTLIVHPDVIPPAPIVDFAVNDIGDTYATVSFTATGDDGVVGRASSYDIRFSTSELTQDNWAVAESVLGALPPSHSGNFESFRVAGLSANTRLWLAVRSRDNLGLLSDISNVVEITTLGAQLQVSPSPIPSITLMQGEQLSFDLTVENVGTAELRVVPSIGGELDASNAIASQYFANAPIAKGDVDYRIGAPVMQSFGGPDGHGYRWTDSDDASGPAFNWRDISATGNVIAGFYDDNVVGPIDIGFEFPFYGEIQRALYVSSNGFISFDAVMDSGCCAGSPLPVNDRINHIIAWLWYDLHPRLGTVHYELIDPSTLVIQFTNYGEFSGPGTVDAQVVLYANGTIDLIYRGFRDGMRHSRASIGIENGDGTDGLQIAFNTDYLHDELAVRITRYWLLANTSPFAVLPAESTVMTLTVDATTLAPGNYESEIVFHSNDADEPTIRLPIVLEVTAVPE